MERAKFSGTMNGSYDNFEIRDDVHVIPEPTTTMGLVLAGLAVVARRRRRRA